MKEKIARWYKWNIWTKEMVYDAVLNNVIKMDDYLEIVGEK